MIPKTIVEHVKMRARALGVSIEEYLLELISQNLNPEDKAKEYSKVAIELIKQAKEELRKDNLRQASEKIWGAAALSIKAHAYLREGKRLSSHRELWKYKDEVVKELGEWVRNAWAHASSMHVCFYEGWCTKRDVEASLKSVEKLVKATAEIVLKQE